MIPQTLRSACAEKNLIPIVGAGVSMSLKRTSGDVLFPSWKGLLEKAAERLKLENIPKFADGVSAMLALDDYEQAANIARKGLTGGLWNSFFTENFEVKRDEICEDSLALPRAIWKIGTQIITLNYDKVLRFACPEASVKDFDNNDSSSLASFGQPNHRTHSIWHLHGRIDQANEIIFTSESYSKLYRENNEKYQAALIRFQSVCRDTKLLFVGCSLDDADILKQISEQHELFGENTGPHYALVRECDKSAIEGKLKGLPIALVTFSDFGAPLIELLNEIAQCGPQNLPQIQTPATKSSAKVLDTTQGKVRIAILAAKPIDKNFVYDELEQEFRKLKADVILLHLSIKTLNELEDFDYIFILSKTIKHKIGIEDETLKVRWITVKELEDNIGCSNGKGHFIFLDHQKKTDFSPLELEQLTQPTLIFPALDNRQIASFSFKIFNKPNLEYNEVYQGCNIERLEVVALKGKQNFKVKQTSLPANIDPKTTKNYVGRRTDLENICRKIIELRVSREILTIKGSGGLGKTITIKRLAVELADRSCFEDGIHFIDCEFIENFKAFEEHVAGCFDLDSVLNFQEQLRENFSYQDRLIILDNAETLLHLASSEPIKEFMVFLSEYASIVVTSRELIELDCEQFYELRPFTTDEAFELFVSELPWSDKITEEDKRVIRHDILESLLDNNPLAIKLITKNIPKGKNFAVLKHELEIDFFQKVSLSELAVFDSASDVNIERKKSLYGSINFSYQYLNDKEKVAFELLSLFPDGINLESLKNISKENKSDSKRSNKKAIAPERLLITDPLIKALENKSLIQVDNGMVKLQSIVGKFADRQFQLRSEAERARYYKNAFEHNYTFAMGLCHFYFESPFHATRITNNHQNNFIKSIRYVSGFKFDHEALLSYIGNLFTLFSAITGTELLFQVLKEQKLLFNNEKERLCYDILMLNLDYYGGNFAGAYSRLQNRLPLAQLANLDDLNEIESKILSFAMHLYVHEGEALLSAKYDIANKNFDFYSYKAEFFWLGYFNKALLPPSPRVDFMTLDVMYSLGLLTQEIINAYIKQGIFEKSHLEMTQVHYIKAKMGLMKKQSIKPLIVVNPYTEGLKQLMYAFVEKDQETKTAYFDSALEHLTHIKYYYVEALYFYAQFLKDSPQKDKFDEIFQVGIGLARKHHYRFQIYKFEQLVTDTPSEYDMNNYPLLEELDFDGHVNSLLKERRRH